MSNHKAIVVWNSRRMMSGEYLRMPEILEAVARTKNMTRSGHPEALWLQPWCRGLTADIGCGAEKVHPTCLGIDRLEPGQVGKTGCMLGVQSSADVSADAGDLGVFPNGVFDSVVSRHCFEHLVDPQQTLAEWLRIIQPGGHLSMVLPDDRAKNFLLIDSDHKFRCYPETVTDALAKLNASTSPFKGNVIEIGTPVVPQWSFFALIRRSTM